MDQNRFDLRAMVLARLEDRNMTQADLAEALGISPQAVSSLLRRANPTVETIFRLARALRCSVSDMLDW